MVDTVSKSRRSEIMASVRSKNNLSTEMRFVGLLKEEGIKGWRRHCDLPGKPDFVWKRAKLAVFLDGCFWHGCSNCYRPPKSNIEFWKNKVESNKKRDVLVTRSLRKNGWVVIRLKECVFRNERKLSDIVKKITAVINNRLAQI